MHCSLQLGLKRIQYLPSFPREVYNFNFNVKMSSMVDTKYFSTFPFNIKNSNNDDKSNLKTQVTT